MPNGTKVDGEDFARPLIDFEIPMLFGNLHNFVGSSPVGASGFIYEFDHIECIRDEDAMFKKPESIDENVYLELSEIGVFKHCPHARVLILEDGTLIAASSMLSPDWLGFGKLVSASDVPLKSGSL